MEERFRRECKKFKEPLPARIANKPELLWGTALFFNAWFELDQERDRREGEYIGRSACFQYARDYDLNEEQRDDLWFYIRKMDAEFLPWWVKRQPKQRLPKGMQRGADTAPVRS